MLQEKRAINDMGGMTVLEGEVWRREGTLTQPVCEEGMPPEPMRRVASHLRSLYQ